MFTPMRIYASGMFERGRIILVPFPFTDLTAQKVRPALIVSNNTKQPDVIVAFISTVLTRPTATEHVLVRERDPAFVKTGLKFSSIIRCDKLSTLDKRIVLGELGSLPTVHLRRVNRGLRVALGC